MMQIWDDLSDMKSSTTSGGGSKTSRVKEKFGRAARNRIWVKKSRRLSMMIQISMLVMFRGF